MPSTPPTTKGPALPSSATAKKRAFIPSVVNPYSEFTQPQFDAFVSDITTKIRDALHGGRKGKGKDMSLFGGSASTTSVEQGDAMGFEQFSFSNKVRNGNGVLPLDAVEALTDEKEQEEDTEQEEQGEVDDGVEDGVEDDVEERVPWPASYEGQELPGPPHMFEQGAGGANDPIVIDLLDSDEEELPQVNGKCGVDDHEGSQDEIESDEDEDEEEDVLGRQQNNLIVIGSDEESEHDEEQRAQALKSDQLGADKVWIEECVGDALPASSPPPDDQEDEEDHNDDTEPDHIHTPYESFVANMDTSGSALPYAEGPGLHVEKSGYTSEITDPYYSLYDFDDISQGYVDPISSQTSNRARQRSSNEEGMSWTYPPAFPPRSDSVSGHETCQGEEPHHRVFSVSGAGYGIPTSMMAGYPGAYAPVDETQYHSIFQADQSVQHLPMGPTELVSGIPFDTVDTYVDLAIDPSLDGPNSVNGEGIKSGVPTDEPGVEEPAVDLPVIATEASEDVEESVEESVEEPVEIPVIEIDATDVDPSALETTTYGTGALVSMLTPDLRPLMELPSPTSPTVGFFPTHGKSQVPQVNEIDLVDSEQLTPDGVIHPSQKLGRLKQDTSTVPLVKSPVNALPTPQPVVKNGRVFETLREGLDPPEQALTVSETDLIAQDTTTLPMISATSEGQVGTPLESEAPAFVFDNESQPLSALEEGHAPGNNDEKSERHSIRGSSILSGESQQDALEEDAAVSPQRRQSMGGTSINNGLSRELQRLQHDAGTIVLDGPRLRRTSSSKSGGAPAVNASVRGRRRGGVVKQVSPRKRATTPLTSMPPPSDVPKRNKVLRSSSRASSVASDQSFQRPPSVSSSLDSHFSSLEPKLDTTLGAETISSAGNTPTTKKRKRRPRTSMPGDEVDYVPEEVEEAHKKRKIEMCDATEADPPLTGVDLGEVLAIAEGTPDLKAKRAIGDEGSPCKSIGASPSTLRACIVVEGSAEDGEQQRFLTQSDDSHTDSDLTPVPSGDDGVETCEASSPSKRAQKRRSRLMDSQHTSYKPPADSEESESETGSASRHGTVRRTNMPNGYEIEVLSQDTKRSTPVYEEVSDGSISDSSGTEGSLYSNTVGSTEESTTVVGGAPEEPKVKVDGLGPMPKSVRRKSGRMRRIQQGNLAYKPSASSESEGDVEQLLEQEEMKERERRRRKALRKARRTRERRAALAEGSVVDANTPIKSRKRKRPSETVQENENRKGKRKQVEGSVGDPEPRKKKRVKKDHYTTEMDKVTPVTNGVTKPDQASQQAEPAESDLKLPVLLETPSQADLTLASHKPVVLDAPFFITNEKDKGEAGAWWFGRLFSKNLT